MKVILSIAFSVLLLSFSETHYTTNFTGKWKLNPTETDFGILPKENTPDQIIINQQNNQLTIQRITPDSSADNGIKQYSETLLFDTTKLSRIVRQYDGVIKYSRFKWNSDSEFIISSEYRQRSDSTRTVQYAFETWTISEDGKKCTVSAHLQTASASGNFTWMLAKQND